MNEYTYADKDLVDVTDPKNKGRFEKGMTVMVYHNWMMEDQPDAKVKLIERQWAEKDRDILGFTTEYWTVEYPDGQELFRFFKTQDEDEDEGKFYDADGTLLTYADKHLVDVTDPNEPCEEDYLKHIGEVL